MGNSIFELLQIAIGKRDRLSHTPTIEEWRGLFADSQKQSVVGIAFAGVERLPKEQWPPQALLFEWIGAAERIKQKNALLDRQCVQLQKRFAEAGIKTSILKGQGVARYYDVSSLRQPGDIDIYVDCGRERLFEIVDSLEVRGDRQSEDKNRKSLIRDWDYKHLHLDVFRDTEVEVHYRVEVLLNLWKNRKLQKWFKEHEEEVFGQVFSLSRIGDFENPADNLHQKSSRIEEGLARRPEGESQFEIFCSPTVEFNRFYILLHIYRHFLYEGVGLRQLLDYYYVLRANTNNTSGALRSKSENNLTKNQSRIREGLARRPEGESQFENYSTDQSRIRDFENYSTDQSGIKGFKNSSTDGTDLTDLLKQFGMWKFARGVMWILQEAFGLEREYMIGEPLEKEGRFILSEVMAGGNFGHHDERLATEKKGKMQTVKKVLKHNMHLMRHYPAEIIWPPIWFVWHKCWKWSHMKDIKN